MILIGWFGTPNNWQIARASAPMVAARALQGVGGSLMLGIAPKLIALAYGEGERGLALGLFSTAFATGISVGAPMGGVITTYLGWPFIFFINLPIGAGIFWASGRVLRPLKARKAWSWQSFDPLEAAILAGTLGLLLLGLTRMQQSGWSAETLGALGLAALLALALYFRERRRPDPLLHPELWRRWPFVAGSLAVVLTFASVMGAFVGYGLGRYLGLPVANRLFGKYMPRVQKYFDRWGAWAVFIAAFTPVPFKVFTWASGIFRVDLRKFALACVAGRFLQFAIAAYAGSLLGPWAIIFLGGI